MLLAASLAACGRPAAVAARTAKASEAGYLTPPVVVDAARGQNGALQLTGDGPGGAAVRLASVAGEAFTATTDEAGRWSLSLPRAPQARLFALSARVRGRVIEAEGFLLTGPAGEAALLRAGASAVRLDPAPARGATTLDLDAAGGGLVSGRADPGSVVAVRLDGGASGQTRADDTGRFSYSLPRLTSGVHRIDLSGVSLQQGLVFDSTPPAAQPAGPFAARPTPQGLRADWLTPGGGVQSTILFNRRSAS